MFFCATHCLTKTSCCIIPCFLRFTDTLGRMHSDAQFAGSSSVPAHVEMMGLIGMGNNPMVGATLAVAVAVQQAADAGKFLSRNEEGVFENANKC